MAAAAAQLKDPSAICAERLLFRCMSLYYSSSAPYFCSSAMSEPANNNGGPASTGTHEHSVVSSSIVGDGLPSASHFSPSSPTRQTQRPSTVSRDDIDSSRQDQAIPCTNDRPVTPAIQSNLPPVTPILQFTSHNRASSRASISGLHLDTNVQDSTRHVPALANRLTALDPSREQMSDKGSLSPISTYFPLHTSRSYDMSYAFSPVSASGLNSPALSAMIDITPLPSPMTELAPRRSSSSMGLSRSGSIRSVRDERIPSRHNSLNQSPRKRKPYGNLMTAAVEAQAHSTLQNERQVHGRNRSISEFVPETLHNLRPRVATFGPEDLNAMEGRASRNHEPSMQREEYLATQRGLTKHSNTAQALPSPPPSNTSVAESEVDDEEPISEQAGVEYFNISSGPQGRKRKWRSIRQLGQGTFSKVLLATSEKISSQGPPDEERMDPSKLVAVKICEHGPSGGADEERIKQSLGREIEILKSVSHPSVVHLKALEEVPGRTFLVLTYCTGGDLFEFASQRRDLLTPSLVQRMFSELVSAVRYLHRNWIVHRDIKLESESVAIS